MCSLLPNLAHNHIGLKKKVESEKVHAQTLVLGKKKLTCIMRHAAGRRGKGKVQSERGGMTPTLSVGSVRDGGMEG
jgi:hypothetical protein